MLENYGDILNIDELCEVLLIGKNTAYKLLESREINGFRFGRKWKISKVALQNYIINKSGMVGKL